MKRKRKEKILCNNSECHQLCHQMIKYGKSPLLEWVHNTPSRPEGKKDFFVDQGQI